MQSKFNLEICIFYLIMGSYKKIWIITDLFMKISLIFLFFAFWETLKILSKISKVEPPPQKLPVTLL